MRFDFQSLKDRLATPQKIFTGIPTPPTGEEKSKASSVVLPIYEKENSTQGLILQKRIPI